MKRVAVAILASEPVLLGGLFGAFYGAIRFEFKIAIVLIASYVAVATAVRLILWGRDEDPSG